MIHGKGGRHWLHSVMTVRLDESPASLAPDGEACPRSSEPSRPNDVGNEFMMEQIISTWRPGEEARVDAKVLVKFVSSATEDVIAKVLPKGSLSTLLLGCYDECIEVLRPYFEDSKRTETCSSTLIREQLRPTRVCPSEQLAIWDNDSSWKTNGTIRNAPLWILSHLGAGSVDKFERAGKFVPFVLLAAEDHEPAIRLLGVRIIREYLRCVPDHIVSQMQLYALFQKTLSKNLSFGEADLGRESLDVLINLIMRADSISSKVKLEMGESLLPMLAREALFCREDSVRSVYLSFIPSLLRHMGVASVCYIKNVLALLMDLPRPLEREDALLQLDIVDGLLDCAWPRLGRHGPVLNEVISRLDAVDDASRLDHLRKRVSLLGTAPLINTG